jgi:hypothetical protein
MLFIHSHLCRGSFERGLDIVAVAHRCEFYFRAFILLLPVISSSGQAPFFGSKSPGHEEHKGEKAVSTVQIRQEYKGRKHGYGRKIPDYGSLKQ